jgi:hypothetical protein
MLAFATFDAPGGRRPSANRRHRTALFDHLVFDHLVGAGKQRRRQGDLRQALTHFMQVFRDWRSLRHTGPTMPLKRRGFPVAPAQRSTL